MVTVLHSTDSAAAKYNPPLLPRTNKPNRLLAPDMIESRPAATRGAALRMHEHMLWRGERKAMPTGLGVAVLGGCCATPVVFAYELFIV